MMKRKYRNTGNNQRKVIILGCNAYKPSYIYVLTCFVVNVVEYFQILIFSTGRIFLTWKTVITQSSYCHHHFIFFSIGLISLSIQTRMYSCLTIFSFLCVCAHARARWPKRTVPVIRLLTL